MAEKGEIEKLQDLIKDTIGGEVVKQTVEPLLPPGENYGSIMYRVDFKVRKENKEQEFHAVAKCPPLNPLLQEIFNIQVTVKAEIAWYTTIIPTLKQFQRDHGVKQEIDFFQKLYGARISLNPNSEKVDLDGVILTQNLKYLGYQNIDRHIGFDEPTTYAILKDLATFHAIPLAIRIQNKKMFNKNIETYMSFLNIGGDTKEVLVKNTLAVFEHLPECKPIMERIRRSVEKSETISARPVRDPWITVTHSDFWINNIMTTQGKNIKTIILDFQSSSIGSPAADLLLLLLSSVKLDVIQNKFDDFVRFYYDQFCKNLIDVHVSIEKFTFEGLLKEIDIEAQAGEFAQALDHSQVMLTEKGTTVIDSSDANFKEEDFVNHKPPVNEKQIEKFRWLAFEAAKRKWI